MKQIKKLIELEGKTITSARIVNSDERLILFFDNEYLAVSANIIGETAEIETWDELYDKQKLELGIISQADFDLSQKAAIDLHNKGIERSERQTLARLTEKYGS